MPAPVVACEQTRVRSTAEMVAQPNGIALKENVPEWKYSNDDRYIDMDMRILRSVQPPHSGVTAKFSFGPILRVPEFGPI